MDVGLSPGDFLGNIGTQRPLPKGGGAPKFSVHVYCGPTPSNFWPMSIVATVAHLSHTAELLLLNINMKPHAGSQTHCIQRDRNVL